MTAEENEIDLLAGLEVPAPVVEDQTPAAEEPQKKRGPKSRADIEAELRTKIEAELREKIEAELHSKQTVVNQTINPSVDAEAIREQVRREFEAEQAQKEREAAEARALAAEARPVKGNDISGDPTAEDAITINFVEDGLTLLGKVWFRGEELTVVPGTRQWEEIQIQYKGQPRNLLTLDEDEQIDRWGVRFFREGLWRGKSLTDLDDPDLTDEERAVLVKAQQLRDEKYGPVLT